MLDLEVLEVDELGAIAFGQRFSVGALVEAVCERKHEN
jgi:hypothetical protein